MNKQTIGFISGVVAAVTMLIVGCTGWNPFTPKITSPISGQQVTAPELQLELHQAEQKAEVEQKTADRKFARTIKSIQTQAESDIQTATDEYADDIGQRVAAVEAVRLQTNAGLEVLEARQTMISNTLSFLNSAAQATGIVPLIAGTGLLTGIGGMFLGKRGAQVEGEQKASIAHDEAWEESKKELLSFMAMFSNAPSRAAAVPSPAPTAP